MITWLCLGARITGALAFLPLFNQVRLGLLKFAIGLLVAYLALPFAHSIHAATSVALIGDMVANAGMGIVSGFVLQLVILGVEMAGGIMDIDLGFSLAQSLSPTFQESGTPISTFLLLVMTGVFFGVNGQGYFIQAVVQSFNASGAVQWAGIAQMVGAAILAGLEMSLPLLITLLVFDLSLNMLTRSAVVINIFTAGFTLRIGAGLVVLFLSIPFMGAYFQDVGIRAFQDIYNMIG